MFIMVVCGMPLYIPIIIMFLEVIISHNCRYPKWKLELGQDFRGRLYLDLYHNLYSKYSNPPNLTVNRTKTFH